MDIERRFPCVADMQIAARKRLPKFVCDYLMGSIGRGGALENNRRALDTIKFTPRFLSSQADHPNCSKMLFGRQFDAPFGVAPIGLGGLIWPKAAEYLARAAHAHNIPFTLSSYATTSLETIAGIAQQNAWYQLYATVDEKINQDMLDRAKVAGYEVLVITVDVPQPTRRDHDIRNGISVPPNFDIRTILSVAANPRWALATAKAGLPTFENMTPYMPNSVSLDEMSVFMSNLGDAHITLEQLKGFRDNWPGTLIVKGILSAEDASECQTIGVDAISVSNHGGRQLEASLSPVEALPDIRNAVGKDMILLADGGARTGLDIATLLAVGADFVLLGRAFMFAIAAMGEPGAEHVIDVLKQELSQSVSQIGSANLHSLANFLASTNQP
jgi:isopentenyl diphosphate isomerase/L-lactate dehydrogenase-like FMN-dependent dehydrogenase